MRVIAVRTDNPQAELYLFEDGVERVQEIWQAHRELSATIHSKLKSLLEEVGKQLADIEGVIFFQGPGSFTGLRIGSSVVNALGASLQIPVVAAQGEDWRQKGVARIAKATGFQPIEPFYGADPHITAQKK